MNNSLYFLALLGLVSGTVAAACLLGMRERLRRLSAVLFWVMYWQAGLIAFGILVGCNRKEYAVEIVAAAVLGGAVGGIFGAFFGLAAALFASCIDRPLKRRVDPSRHRVRACLLGALIWFSFGAVAGSMLLPATHAVERFGRFIHYNLSTGHLDLDWRFLADSITNHTPGLALIGAIACGIVGAIGGLLAWKVAAPTPVRPAGDNPFAEDMPTGVEE